MRLEREGKSPPPGVTGVILLSFCLITKSCLTLVTPWTVVHQAPLPMDFSGKNAGVGCQFLVHSIFLS